MAFECTVDEVFKHVWYPMPDVTITRATVSVKVIVAMAWKPAPYSP